MDVFGEVWRDHASRLREAWNERVTAKDTVLIAGDISWAMRENEVEPDMAFLQSLPGRKVLLKGNHDYWWSTAKKVGLLAGSECAVLQTGAIDLGSVAIVGTRGWDLPNSARYTDEDRRIFAREIIRLRLSLEAGAKLKRPLMAMTHFPPLQPNALATPFTELFEEYGVQICVYGHLHGAAHRQRVEGRVGTVEYRLVSADYLQFHPVQLLP